MKTHLELDFDIDCPWCSGPMTAASDGAGDSLACPTCSIVVELAADPSTASVALAA